MRSLIIVALCLGLASAAPATDLLRALLKRQEAETMPAVPASDENPGFALPTEEELTALSYLGYSIEFLAEMAEQSPADFLTYINSLDGTEKRNLQGGRGKGPNGGKGPKGPMEGGKPPRPGGPQSGEGMEDQFMKEIMKKGVYKTVVGHVKMMAKMLQYSPQIFEHMIKGPNCQDCPDVPTEVMDIIMGEGESMEKRQAEVASSEDVSSEESDEEDKSGPKGKGPKGNGPRPNGEGPRGKGPKGKGPGPKSSEEEAESEVGTAELAKRLMSFLAKRQTADPAEVASNEDVSSEESDEDDKSGPKGKGPRPGQGPRPNGEGPRGKGPKGKGPKPPKSSEEEASSEVDAAELAKRLMSFLAKRQ